MLMKIINENLDKMNKKTLKKVINLINFLMDEKKELNIMDIKNISSSEKFLDSINKLENDKIKKDIYNIRINSIIETYKYEEYTNKHSKKYYTIYEYSDRIVIYFKKNETINNEDLKKELEMDINNYNYTEIIYKTKEKSKNIFKIKKINFFKKRDINDIINYEKITIKNLYHTK